MVLTALLFIFFDNNLLDFPNHVIHVPKHDVININTNDFTHQYTRVNLISSSTTYLSKIVDLSKLYIVNKTKDEF